MTGGEIHREIPFVLGVALGLAYYLKFGIPEVLLL